MTAVELKGDTPAIYDTNLKVPVDKIVPSAANPRRDATPDEPLIASIREIGLIEPLVVRPAADGMFELLAGHRRLEAVKAAGFARVPCVLRHASDAQAVEIMLVENLARQDLTPLEEAQAIGRITDLGRSQRDIAQLIGVSQSHISKRLALLKLPDAAREAVDSGSITVEDALKITRLPDVEVTGLFKKGTPARWDIDNAVRRMEFREAREKAIAELRGDGVEILPDAPGWNAAHAPCRVASIGVDIDEHRGASCRAVYVDSYGHLTECCTDPAAHGGVTSAGPITVREVPVETVAGEQADAVGKRIDRLHDADRRVVWHKEYLAKSPINQEYPAVISLASLILPLMSDAYLAATADSLSIDPEDGDDDWERFAIQLQQFSAADAKNPVRVLLAMVLDLGNTLTLGHLDDGSPELTAARAYLAWLRDHRYPLSDDEAALLEGLAE